MIKDNNILKSLLFLIIVISSPCIVLAQNVSFDKDNFKDRKSEFKEARRYLEAGNMLYQRYSSGYLDVNDPEYRHRIVSYREALTYLKEAQKFNPDNAVLNYKLGRCYLFSNKKDKSLTHFKKAYELSSDVAEDIHYYLAVGYHMELSFDLAIKEYNKYKATMTSKKIEELKHLNKKIGECKTGKKMVANPVRVFIDNIGRTINTKYPEYGVIITADESEMMFTSRRNTSTGGKYVPESEEIESYFEDIYITNKENGKWTEPRNMGRPVNSDEHDATVAVSPDGQRMIVYKDEKAGDLYECKLKGDLWSKPKAMSKNINSNYHESSASYSYDGKTFYFVSNMPGGYGNHDIYKSTWNAKKEDWGDAENLGAVINTEHNEEAVIIHPDGRTMYFSSQGHSTMGGYDIFKSVLQDDGTWSKPVNIGYPINSPDDDVFFVISASGRRGYYSSLKNGGYGDKDIYMITMLGPEKPLQLNAEDNLLASVAKPVNDKVVEKTIKTDSKKITLLKGVVREDGSKKPIGAEVELIDVEANKVLATFNSNETTGKYLLSLPSGRNYGFVVNKKGYLFHSENFNIPKEAAFIEVVKNIDLKRIKVGNYIVLNNIFYDYNKASLRDASMNELDRLTKLLIDNPSIKIEVSAHTDSRGSDKYNQTLSQKRAQSCVDYLLKKGIKSSRLVAKGYGEKKLVVEDAAIEKLSTPEEKEDAHQQNRRTEIKVLDV